MTRPASLRPGRRHAKFSNATVHVTGVAMAMSGAGMVLAGLVDALDGGPDVAALVGPGLATTAVGLALRAFSSVPKRLPIRSVFVAVAITWGAVCIAGAIPYVTTGATVGWVDGLFESVAGFTTTGATVFSDVEALSAGMLFWRALTQWLGGLGVIVLAVAVIPYLGAGGMTFVRAELPPASEYLAPRVRETARRLWGVYFSLTAVIFGAFALGGMSAFDAAAHAFTTVSTGGFSTRNANFGAFESATLEWIATVAMFAGGVNIVLVWRAVRGHVGPLLTSTEVRAYAILLAVVSALAIAWNQATTGLDHGTIREAVFSIVSVGSTTGFSVVDFGGWTQASQAALLLLLFVGATTGSTGGGPKVLRLLAAISYARREISRHLHPRLVAPVRIGREVLPDEVVSRILGYYAVFLLTVIGASITVAAFDVDITTSVSATVSAISNVGPGLGAVSPGGGYFLLDAPARAVLMLVMLMGRIEIYPVLLGLAAIPDNLRSVVPARVARAVTRQL